MDVLTLHEKFIRELISLYRELPAVWKVKSIEYKNKDLKRESYDILVRKCREYVHDADREFVKNKINSLRTSFRKEYKKYLKSKEDFQDSDDQEDDSLTMNEEPGFFDLKSEPGSPHIPLTEDNDPLSTHVAKKSFHVDITPVEDVYDAIGKNVAHKLRGMSQQQRIIAEKIIGDVMYYGQMESLTPDSHLTFQSEK